MKSTILVAILAVAPAYATDYSSQSLYNQTHTSSASEATAAAIGLGVGVGHGGAGGTGGAGGAGVGQGGAGGTAGGGSASLTYNEAPAAAQRGTVTIKNTPEVTLSNIAPTSPCMGGTSVGGSGPGFSIGIGTTWKDSDCSLRETARSFAGLGLTDDAIAILCSSEYAAAAPSCKALKKD